MKNMNKKLNKINSIKEHPNFKKESEKYDAFLRLAIEVNEIRNSKGWSQKELADNVGTTQKVVSKIENGDVNLGLDLLQRLARSLGSKLQFGKSILVKGAPESQVERASDAESSVVFCEAYTTGVHMTSSIDEKEMDYEGTDQWFTQHLADKGAISQQKNEHRDILINLANQEVSI